MTNEEKARELSHKWIGYYRNSDVETACLEMAQWKDEQYKNLIKERIDNCILTDAYESVQYETYMALFKDLFKISFLEALS